MTERVKVDLELRDGLVGVFAGPDLPESHGQRIDVDGLCVVLARSDEFWCHERHRSQNGHALAGSGLLVALSGGLAEVAQLDHMLVSHEKVLGLKVSVNKAHAVETRNGLARIDTRSHAHDGAPFLCVPLQICLEVSPFAKLENHGNLRRSYTNSDESNDVSVR